MVKSPEGFDANSYTGKIGLKTSQIEEDANALEAAIKDRDIRLTRLTEGVRGEISALQNAISTYKVQIEKNKRILINLLRVYKLCTRKEELFKLAEKVDRFPFEKLITRSELQRLIELRSEELE